MEDKTETKKNRQILTLLFFGVLMGALDISVVGPAIPAIEKTMVLHGREISWIFSAYVLFYLFGIPMMSKLSDVHGRKIMYIASLVVFAVGSAIVSVSDNLMFLLTGRAIQGFGSSGIFPVAAATIGDRFTATERGKALGMLGAVYGVAFIVGPILAGSILHYFNWHVIFLVNIPIAVVLIVFAINLLPGKPEGTKPKINWPEIALLATTLSAFTIGLNNIDTAELGKSLQSVNVWPFFLFALVGTVVFVKYDRKPEDPFISQTFFKSKQLKLVAMIAFGLGLFQASIVFIPKYAVQLFGVSPAKASFMLLPLVIATALVPPISGRLLNNTGSRIIIVAGLAAATISLLLLYLHSHSLALFYIAEAGIGIGLSIRVSLKYIVLNEIAPRERATSLGMLIVLILVGQLTGAALMGIIISGSEGKSGGFASAFLLLTFLTAILVIISSFLKEKKTEIPHI